MNIAVFASGGGSNFKAILNHFKHNREIKVNLLVSNNSNCGAVEIALEVGIDIFHFSKKVFPDLSAEEYSGIMLSKLDEYKIGLIVLAGYMKKLETKVVKNYNKKILNLHPALLPAFGGKGLYGEHVHKAVIESGVKLTGITIHFVDENYDTGKIIFQKSIPVTEDDTVEKLTEKTKELEHQYYPKVIEQVAIGNITEKGNNIFLTEKI